MACVHACVQESEVRNCSETLRHWESDDMYSFVFGDDYAFLGWEIYLVSYLILVSLLL